MEPRSCSRLRFGASKEGGKESAHAWAHVHVPHPGLSVIPGPPAGGDGRLALHLCLGDVTLRRCSLEAIVLPLPPAGLDPLGLLNRSLMGAARRARLAREAFEVVSLVMEVVEIPLAARHPSPGMERGASVWGFLPADAAAVRIRMWSLTEERRCLQARRDFPFSLVTVASLDGTTRAWATC